MSLFGWMEQNWDIKYCNTTECFLDLFLILGSSGCQFGGKWATL
jgi:hypothetical protein